MENLVTEKIINRLTALEERKILMQNKITELIVNFQDSNNITHLEEVVRLKKIYDAGYNNLCTAIFKELNEFESTLRRYGV